MAYSNRNMDDLLARWTASNRQDPQLLFPGTHAEILVLLQEWWTRRKQSHAQLMALRAQLQDQSSAVLSSATATPPLSRAVKQKMASKALEIISQANVPIAIPFSSFNSPDDF